jgi:hypothetical protein
MSKDDNRLNPCELDPVLREGVERSIMLDLSKGYRFVVSFPETDTEEVVYDIESILRAICEERDVVRLAP